MTENKSTNPTRRLKQADAEPDLETILDDIRKKPTVPVWPHVGRVNDLTRNGAYAAVARGEIEVIRFGRLIRAVSAPLRKKLYLAD